MAQQSQKVIVTLDRESKALMRRIANALERSNQPITIHNTVPKPIEVFERLDSEDARQALFSAGIDAGKVLRAYDEMTEKGLYICKKTE